MIYPSFLKHGDTIGISAPSQGVGGKLESYESSLETLKKQGWKIRETAHVRVDDARGGTARERGAEVTELFADDNVDLVMAAAGGDFLNEVLPYIDWSIIQKHPKWYLGASDPTSILFPITTGLDIASFYGANAGSFDPSEMNAYTEDTLRFLKGELPVQHSSRLHSDIADFLPEYKGMNVPTVWQSNRDEIHLTGRCIGGCIDALKDLIGTKYDHVHSFVEKYREDGIIWFFDNFSMSAENFYRTLCQFQYAGWLAHTKAIIIGRVLFQSSETGMSYEEACSRALGSFPYIYKADIGHTVPSFTMINGAVMHLDYKEGKGSISFELK